MLAFKRIVDRASRLQPWQIALTLGASLTGVVIASPFLTSWMASLPLDWQDLSNVGQAYGAISAVLSGIALCGITASLLMQRQQYRLSEHQSVRQRHHDLIKMTFEDPSLKACWGESSSGTGLTENEAAYCNLIVDYWHMLWRISQINSENLQRIASSFFNGEVGRTYWSVYGKNWLSDGDRRTAAFRAILDIELARAIAGGPPAVCRIEGDGEAAVGTSADANAGLSKGSGNDSRNLMAAAAVVGAFVALTIRRIVARSLEAPPKIRS
ncbi:DUF6082 family protein [Actinoplanes sp. NPDC051633]|uniref:DUF6082 family protein n=1 Tax=Actinoplanes sp. NPDC051633 TaxID=3155670 RepID=UPI00342FDA86